MEVTITNLSRKLCNIDLLQKKNISGKMRIEFILRAKINID